MKRIIILLLIICLFPVNTIADVTKNSYGNSCWFTVTPGLYEVGEGKDIEPGTYDVRFGDGDEPLTITFSEMLNDENKPDLDFYYSYCFSFFTSKWPGGSHPVVYMPSYGYMLIEGRSCRLYPVKTGY